MEGDDDDDTMEGDDDDDTMEGDDEDDTMEGDDDDDMMEGDDVHDTVAGDDEDGGIEDVDQVTDEVGTVQSDAEGTLRNVSAEAVGGISISTWLVLGATAGSAAICVLVVVTCFVTIR